MLLAVDTSAGTSVAVVDGGRILSENSVEDTRRHAEVIGELIVRCLAEAGVDIAGLSNVAVGMGPGPFTGLRVGIAAAQAFALGADIRVLRVPSHDAIAFAHFSATTDNVSGVGEPLLVTTDARRHERYWSSYRRDDDSQLPRRVDGPGIAPASDYDDGALNTEWISAGALGLLAEIMHQRGSRFASPKPLYLRSPDVTVATTLKRVTG